MALFLCATMHQGDERFNVQTRGKQCAFMSLAAVMQNAFYNDRYAILVLEGYMMALIKQTEFFYLIDSHARDLKWHA